jgi:hypothetical protein
MVVKREYLRFWFVWRLIFGGLAILGVLLYTWDFLSFGLGPETRPVVSRPVPTSVSSG